MDTATVIEFDLGNLEERVNAEFKSARLGGFAPEEKRMLVYYQEPKRWHVVIPWQAVKKTRPLPVFRTSLDALDYAQGNLYDNLGLSGKEFDPISEKMVFYGTNKA